ncbi:MAG: zf-HC2 domain-containing protein [Ruminococcus sp.]|uniref:anti-sigma factor family protein n=1 Tax=Ruminococcus sp. TaxID=41978 RepID=UPI0025EEC5F4|nr:zf-HC2 domain-containing protein [Ruminococcus sp.]MCR5599686.1 zf-HC2 domain-containing protein [Ruminococcus sp.]
MKYDHDVIRDLMPLCIDGIASEKSQKIVSEHLAECPDCQKEWEQMKNNIQPSENIPLPEDTSKYKETAKRVRKHHRWMLLKVTCAVIAIIFIGGIVGNFIDGARFTPESAARSQMKDWSADLYETPEEQHNASKSEITVIGTVKSDDGKAADTCALIYRPDLDVTLIANCSSSRCDMLRMGLWISNGGSCGEYAENTGIFTSDTGHSCSYCEKYYGFVTFYVTDKAIKNINFTKNGKAYTLSPDGNGFCGISYELQSYPPRNNSYITEGTATDEKGNVLYTIQEIQNTAEDGLKYTVQEWIKAE